MKKYYKRNLLKEYFKLIILEMKTKFNFYITNINSFKFKLKKANN